MPPSPFRRPVPLVLLASLALAAVPASASPPGAHLDARQRGVALRALGDRRAVDGQRTGIARRIAPLNRLAAVLRGRFAGRAARARLDAFVTDREARFGALTHVRPDAIREPDAFRVEKALLLDASGRTPAQITETFVTARGDVDGVAVAPHRLFVQRWEAVRTAASGALEIDTQTDGAEVVIVPGYQESGHAYRALADVLSRAGHTVTVLDPAYAGHSDGTVRARLDRGFELTRDAAYLTALVGARAGREGRATVLVGDSLGGSLGVAGTMAMAHAGKLALHGVTVPAGVSGIALSPYFRPARGLRSLAVGAVARMPWVRGLPLYSSLAPDTMGPRRTAVVFADAATWFDARGRPRVMLDVVPDATRIAQVAHATGLGGKLTVVETRRDALARAGATRTFAAGLAPDEIDARFLRGTQHAIHNDPRGLDAVLQGVNDAARAGRR